jgi:hypothetical protein
MTVAATEPPAISEHARARSVFEHIYELLNTHDVRHLGEVFTDDIVFEDDAWPSTVRGLVEMERFMTSLWRSIPDLRFEIVEGPFLLDKGSRFCGEEHRRFIRYESDVLVRPSGRACERAKRAPTTGRSVDTWQVDRRRSRPIHRPSNGASTQTTDARVVPVVVDDTTMVVMPVDRLGDPPE